jgi:SLOG cluster3 family
MMRTIFLSASVPSLSRAEEFQRDKYAAFEIEQAVISLARAVFAHDGRLVFGGHPTISPLVGVVAGEYRAPRAAESDSEHQRASVVIYQSEAFRSYAQEDKLLLFKLDLTEVHWTEAVDGELFDPMAPGHGPPCPRSVEAMREEMLSASRPDAMVCIGGMEGVLAEVELFRRRCPGRKIFVLVKTGGAASLLADRPAADITVIDREVIDNMERLRREHHRDAEGDEAAEPPAVPYPLIMQTLVRRVWGDESGTPQPMFAR